MNNWGGVTEHMSLKSKKPFGRKKVARSVSHYQGTTPAEKRRMESAAAKQANAIKSEAILVSLLSIGLGGLAWVLFF